MRCKKAIEHFSAYLDGQLTPPEREAVRSHLAECARCRAELEALERTARALADLPRLQAPSDLRDRVMGKIAGVAPAEARHPRWRMYWGAAAAVLFAVVIMLLTRTAPLRPAGPGPAAAAAKNIPREEAALAEGSVSAGSKGAEEKLPQPAANLGPSGATAASYGAPSLESRTAALRRQPIAPAEQLQIFLPCANPRAAYLGAVAIAAKRGWLPAELQQEGAADELLKAGAREQGRQREPQLTLRMRRSQVPLLRTALDEALQAIEKKGGPAEEAQLAAQPPSAGAPRLAGARADRHEAAQPAAAAPMGAMSYGRVQSANAPSAGAPPAAAGGAAGATVRQLPAENEAQATEGRRLSQERKAEAAEDPIVEVTLRFELLETPVPAAAPAAGAATSAAPQ
jgi:anti-sigma factor (TIGR02949 family)